MIMAMMGLLLTKTWEFVRMHVCMRSSIDNNGIKFIVVPREHVSFNNLHRSRDSFTGSSSKLFVLRQPLFP